LILIPCIFEYVENNQQNAKSTKLKLLKTNAAIWFNKICRSKHLTPKQTCLLPYHIDVEVAQKEKQLLPKDGIVLPKHVGAVVKEK
jgi:hypothetical protein